MTTKRALLLPHTKILVPLVFQMRFLSMAWRTTTTATAAFMASKGQRRLRYYHVNSCRDSFSSRNIPLSSKRSFSTTSSALLSTSTDGNNNFATSYHAPVMWKECIDALLDCQRSVQRRRQQPLQPDSENNDTTVNNTANHNHNTSPSLIFVDGTLGGGGHTAALLERLQPGDVVLGCDVDPAALEVACRRLEPHLGRPVQQPLPQDHQPQQQQEDQEQQSSQDQLLPLLVPVACNFCDLTKKISTLSHPCFPDQLVSPDGKVDGILLDLGVSSYQIDTAERGFAFMKDGPLDMRMSATTTTTTTTTTTSSTSKNHNNTARTSLTAADICNEFSVEDLAQIFKTYGDEPRAKAIARSILQHRPLHTTLRLRQAVAAVVPEYNKKSRRQGLMATLARIFQSLRIVVNQEDQALAKALTDMCPQLIRPGGRLVVLSYHSMEDRAVKRIMKHGNVNENGDFQERDLYGNVITTGPDANPWKVIGKRIKASEEEVQVNPRARSATLRIAERL